MFFWPIICSYKPSEVEILLDLECQTYEFYLSKQKSETIFEKIDFQNNLTLVLFF